MLFFCGAHETSAGARSCCKLNSVYTVLWYEFYFYLKYDIFITKRIMLYIALQIQSTWELIL